MASDLSDFDFTDFWEPSEYATVEYVGECPTPQLIALVESSLGFKLPKAYIQMAQYQNGGIPKKGSHRTSQAAAWAVKDHIAITGIFSIGSKKHYSLCGSLGSKFWERFNYPAIGIYFADCPSGGHDMVALDYTTCGPEGEPTVVHVDQGYDYRKTLVAENFASFIRGLQGDEAFFTPPSLDAWGAGNK